MNLIRDYKWHEELYVATSAPLGYDPETFPWQYRYRSSGFIYEIDFPDLRSPTHGCLAPTYISAEILDHITFPTEVAIKIHRDPLVREFDLIEGRPLAPLMLQKVIREDIQRNQRNCPEPWFYEHNLRWREATPNQYQICPVCVVPFENNYFRTVQFVMRNIRIKPCSNTMDIWQLMVGRCRECRTAFYTNPQRT